MGVNALVEISYVSMSPDYIKRRDKFRLLTGVFPSHQGVVFLELEKADEVYHFHNHDALIEIIERIDPSITVTRILSAREL